LYRYLTIVGHPEASFVFRGGGGEGTRTHDRLVANQVLYQLSYAPLNLVGLAGFEPATSRLSGGRSNQLSYRPNLDEWWQSRYKLQLPPM
jgi:hypothetical protein